MPESFTIYSMEGCSACQAAALLLKERDIDHTVLDAGIDFTADELAERAGKPVRSLPQVFEGETHIGGLADLQNRLS